MAEKCPQTDNWCASELVNIKTPFKWIINNFNGCPVRKGQRIRSSTFGSDKDIKTKWDLQIFPNGETEENEEFVSIFLHLVESDKSEILAKFSFAIIDSNQQIRKQRVVEKHNFDINQTPRESWGYPKFISRSELKDIKNPFLPNDVLTIYCEVTYFGECKTSGQNTGLQRSHNKLLDDMKALYRNPIDCDVQIAVKGHEFSAHKLILKTRSSVFAAMFTHQMKEKKQNKVVIEDIEKEVFSKVLRYIYTDSVVNEDIDSSIQLLSAADKYNLDDLKSVCEEYICSQLTVESVSHVLILADNHSTQELKTKAIAFIKNDRNEVMKTKGWAKVILERSDLLQLF